MVQSGENWLKVGKMAHTGSKCSKWLKHDQMVPNDKQNLKINQNDASLCKMVEQFRKNC